MKKFAILATMALTLASCDLMKEKAPPPRVNVVPILRRNIEVYADASGNIEAMNITEVKSKASGQIIRLTAETGTFYRAGDTLVQVDTKEVDQQVEIAKFDTTQAWQRLENGKVDRARQDALFKIRAITKKEWDEGALNVQALEMALNKAKSAFEIAKQRQNDATVVAPISGTVITRAVNQGQIVTSSTSGVSAGTTLLTMTDLTQLRVRASFNEVDIANIDTGMTAMIMVDALADEQIPGKIAKIEPMATTVQNVTMFPVIITIDNTDGRLRPGMNGSIQVWVERRENAIAVPNEAVRQVQETPFLSQVLSSITGTVVDPDSLKAVVDSQVARLGRRTFNVGDPGQNNGGGAGATPAPAPSGGNPARPGGGNGDVDMSVPGFALQQGRGGQGGGRQGGRTGGTGRGRGPTTEECAPVKSAIAKNAANQKAYDGLIAKLREPEVDRTKINQELRALYSKAGTDTLLGRRCQGLALGGGNFAVGGRGGGGGGGGGGAGGGRGARMPGGDGSGFRDRGRTTVTRNQLVFVVPSPGVYEARVIKTGLGSYEFTEVVEGLREGEQVAILNTAIIALQQQQSRDKMKQNMSNPFGGNVGGANPGGGRGGNPGGGGAPRGGGGAGGGGGGGGGGRGG